MSVAQTSGDGQLIQQTGENGQHKDTPRGGAQEGGRSRRRVCWNVGKSLGMDGDDGRLAFCKEPLETLPGSAQEVARSPAVGGPAQLHRNRNVRRCVAHWGEAISHQQGANV